MPKINIYSSDKINLIINFLGNFWVALINIIFVPVYLKYIGTEGYGLIGIFTSLQIMLSLLDAGLSITLNRELARLTALPEEQHKIRSTIRTLEIIYWGVSLLIGLIAIVLSPFMARYWVNPKDLSIETIQYAFILLSISLTFQFPIGFYSGGLLGLQKQIALSSIKIFFSTLRSVGALIIFVFISNSILVFFAWTLFVTVVWAIVLWRVVWYLLPKSTNTATAIKFDKSILSNIMGFAASMSGISIVAALLTQTDKFILGKMLSLSDLGFYSFSQTYGMAICSLIVPTFYQILFPKFTQMIEINDETLYSFYLDSCQKLSNLLFPIIIFAFALSDIIFGFLYKIDENKEMGAFLFATFLSVALINSTLHLPYNLFVAYGKSKYVFYLYLKIFAVFSLLLYVGTLFFGMIGAAVANLLLQVIYLILLIQLINKHLNFPPVLEWYKKVVFVPFLIIGMIFLISNTFIYSATSIVRILINSVILIGIYVFYEYKYTYFGLKKAYKTYFKND